MKQTLFALLALLVATLLSFNQKQATVRNQVQVVRGEMEQMALGVAAEAMGAIRTQDFDSNLNGTDDVSTEDLTPESEFPTGNRCEAFFSSPSTECDAIEEFHQMSPATVSFKFPDPDDFPDSSDRFEFEIKSVEVEYVDGNFSNETSGETFHKRVTLEIQDIPSDGGDPRLTSPIEYSEVVSYP